MSLSLSCSAWRRAVTSALIASFLAVAAVRATDMSAMPCQMHRVKSWPDM